MRLNRRLTWTRVSDGLYRAGNFSISRIDTMYGPRWEMTHSIGVGSSVTVRRATLHECQSFAGMMAMEMPLFVIADVEDFEQLAGKLE